MRIYECKCLFCGTVTQICFPNEPYPEYGQNFLSFCKKCEKDATFTRTLTRKTKKEIKQKNEENDLRQTIVDCCNVYGFQYRFLYQSVIITTPLSDWCFDYHQKKVTLYHESTTKINFSTGDYAKAHCQFRDKSMSPIEVIEYIASHDQWKCKQNQRKARNVK